MGGMGEVDCSWNFSNLFCSWWVGSLSSLWYHLFSLEREREREGGGERSVHVSEEDALPFTGSVCV